ncbi:peptidoglycan D,D-transpeptidase FtsI family protein [Agaribacterium haliotis]|uniref:peptidoglycan D,D-transpeptidase FtsI family protein n=1 Tax=Agaribacterium haliotis TaxID=2013869 RepID=UPI000BB57CCA|nr:penicillin-binding protein 2 [Agaribacterium haliotis]
MLAWLANYWRISFVIVGMCALPVLLLARASNLLVLEVEDHGISLREEGDDRTVRTESLTAYRGLITDRNGELLAVSTPVKSIYADPKFIREQDIASIASALAWSESRLRERLELYKNKRFMYLEHQLAPHKADKILAYGFSGINGRTEYKRFYPAGEVAAHVLGITDTDENGIEGLELSFNEWLDGEPGSKKVLKNRKQHTIKELGLIKAPQSGQDLQLTLDLKLQYLAYKELKHAIAKQGAKSGSLITVDARSGEILAMVNQPSYNPNHRLGVGRGQMRNRAVTDVFEPGSTVKPLAVAAAMESGRYKATDIIDTSPGYVRVGSKTFMDPVNYGQMDLAKVIKKSSQVAVTKMALDMEVDQIRDVYFRVGLGQSTGIGFPGERGGTLPQRNRWSDIERANFAFGYGLNVNALQLAQAYLVLANDGMFKPLTLVRQQHSEPAIPVLDKNIARQVRQMLRGVTESGGTATRAAIDDYPVAGKTGTAHKVDAKSGGYADDKYRALFAGFAPADKPRLVTVVVVDEPPAYGEYSGGKAAAPIFASVMEKSLKALNVPPADTSNYLSSNSTVLGGRG